MSAAQEVSVPPHQDHLRDMFSLEEPRFKDGGLCKEYGQPNRQNKHEAANKYAFLETHTYTSARK